MSHDSGYNPDHSNDIFMPPMRWAKSRLLQLHGQQFHGERLIHEVLLFMFRWRSLEGARTSRLVWKLSGRPRVMSLLLTSKTSTKQRTERHRLSLIDSYFLLFEEDDLDS